MSYGFLLMKKKYWKALGLQVHSSLLSSSWALLSRTSNFLVGKTIYITRDSGNIVLPRTILTYHWSYMETVLQVAYEMPNVVALIAYLLLERHDLSLKSLALIHVYFTICSSSFSQNWNVYFLCNTCKHVFIARLLIECKGPRVISFQVFDSTWLRTVCSMKMWNCYISKGIKMQKRAVRCLDDFTEVQNTYYSILLTSREDFSRVG